MYPPIKNVMKKFDFKGESGSLQYWEYKSVSNTWVLAVVDKPYRESQRKKGLANYRKRCLNRHVVETEYKHDWLADLAAQTGAAYDKTNHDPDQIMGQLVMPVYSYVGATCEGVIELVTPLPKESYAEEFNQIFSLLKDEKLTTAKMIEVSYKGNTTKFPLPFSSGITSLWEKVTQIYTWMNQNAFQINYNDCRGNLRPISSDDDLSDCITNSLLTGMMTIEMSIKHVAR